MTSYIPSPTVGVLHLGPLPVRMYALCILIGIVVAVWLTGRRLRAAWRRARPGARRRRVGGARSASSAAGSTTSSPRPARTGARAATRVDALKIWEGGLGIWGAIALGALGAWIGCRRAGISFLAFADAAAPGVAFAQAIGRFGNWFNNELYGGPTTAAVGPADPRVGPVRRPGRASTRRATRSCSGIFQPTFLYEAVFLVVLGDRAARHRQAALAGTRPAARALRGRLPGRADRHRDDAHRRGRAHPRPAAQRLDEHRRVPARASGSSGSPAAGARPRGAVPVE